MKKNKIKKGDIYLLDLFDYEKPVRMKVEDVWKIKENWLFFSKEVEKLYAWCVDEDIEMDLSISEREFRKHIIRKTDEGE